MNISVLKTFFSFSLFLICLLLLTGCNDIEITSLKKNREIKIDGKNTEWEGGTFVKDAQLSINAVNDDTFLYISLITSDRNLTQKILSTGLTVWFDPLKKSDDIAGINFPKGRRFAEFMREQRNEGENPVQIKEKIFETFTDFEIIDKDKGVLEVGSINTVKDMEIKMGEDNGNFIYEMKVPLRNSKYSPFSIGATKGGKLKIGFETGTIDPKKLTEKRKEEGLSSPSGFPENGSRPNEDRPEDGSMPRGGPGHNRGGRNNSPMPGNQMGKQEPLKIWLIVQLTEEK